MISPSARSTTKKPFTRRSPRSNLGGGAFEERRPYRLGLRLDLEGVGERILGKLPEQVLLPFEHLLELGEGLVARDERDLLDAGERKQPVLDVAGERLVGPVLQVDEQPHLLAHPPDLFGDVQGDHEEDHEDQQRESHDHHGDQSGGLAPPEHDRRLVEHVSKLRDIDHWSPSGMSCPRSCCARREICDSPIRSRTSPT
jgi:hypothetical protein